MSTKPTPEQIAADAKLIAELGGPAALTRLLKLDYKGARQRVQWWVTRGIPAEMKLQYPHIFLRDLKIDRRKKLPALLKKPAAQQPATQA